MADCCDHNTKTFSFIQNSIFIERLTVFFFSGKYLDTSKILRNVYWQLFTEISGQTIESTQSKKNAGNNQ